MLILEGGGGLKTYCRSKRNKRKVVSVQMHRMGQRRMLGFRKHRGAGRDGDSDGQLCYWSWRSVVCGGGA